jgi:hypothetical protein
MARDFEPFRETTRVGEGAVKSTLADTHPRFAAFLDEILLGPGSIEDRLQGVLRMAHGAIDGEGELVAGLLRLADLAQNLGFDLTTVGVGDRAAQGGGGEAALGVDEPNALQNLGEFRLVARSKFLHVLASLVWGDSASRAACSPSSQVSA